MNQANKQPNQTMRLHHRYWVLVATGLTLLPAIACADNPLEKAGQGILNIMTGGLMTTLAVIVVVVVGLAVMAGRASMEIGVRVIVGVVVIFGAAALVDMIKGFAT